MVVAVGVTVDVGVGDGINLSSAHTSSMVLAAKAVRSMFESRQFQMHIKVSIAAKAVATNTLLTLPAL